MFRIGSALPGRMSACGPDMITSPGLSPSGAMMYRFSPSRVVEQRDAGGAVRIVLDPATFAGIPIFSRRKSTSRSMRLTPPPRCRTVMRP